MNSMKLNMYDFFVCKTHVTPPGGTQALNLFILTIQIYIKILTINLNGKGTPCNNIEVFFLTPT